MEEFVFAFCITICRLGLQKDARPFLSIWKLQVLLWLRKEKSVYIHGGNLLTFPSSLSPPGLSLTLSSPLRVGAQKGTPFQPLCCASFSRRPWSAFYLRNTFPFFNLSPSPTPDINALKPSEDHLLAEWSHSDYGLVMTHTLVVSLCLPWIFSSSWISLSPGNLELSNFSIVLFYPSTLHITLSSPMSSKRCICVSMCLCACVCTLDQRSATMDYRPNPGCG